MIMQLYCKLIGQGLATQLLMHLKLLILATYIIDYYVLPCSHLSFRLISRDIALAVLTPW